MADPIMSEIAEVMGSKSVRAAPHPTRPHRLPTRSVANKLAEQRRLTAIERFAQRHDGGEAPTQAKLYRDLLPRSQPRAGEQYAFEVDLDRCSGCKACVSACHSLNGLDEFELWRNVGLIHSISEEPAYVQTVTSSCHHCVDPACMKGCPVSAYTKDGISGIVKHLDDQCFGCQYCTLMCPYDAPKFSPERGIVRKCDMCSQRLEVGEAPACVQACPTEAIRIAIIEKREAVALAREGRFIADAPSPAPTQPTTRYKTTKKLPRDLNAVDHGRIRVEHAHWPLVVMLTLTQLGVGTLLCSMLLPGISPNGTLDRLWLTLAALGWTAAGLVASVFHLGRPHLAWRAVLNIRSSWLSREALAFGVFAQLLLFYLGALIPAELVSFPGQDLLRRLVGVLGWGSALVGAAGVVCSVMVYVATSREHWSWSRSGVRFLGSLGVLGVASATTLRIAFSGEMSRHAGPIRLGLALLMAFGACKFLWEAHRLGAVSRSIGTADALMAKIMLNRLAPLLWARFLFGALGAFALPLLLLFGDIPGGVLLLVTAATLFFTLGGEFLERATFFQAAPGSRMPGGIS